LGNSGRTEPVQIVGPPGFGDVLRGLCVVAPYLPFEVRCREVIQGECARLEDLAVRCVLADHRAPCVAYRLDLPRARRFLPERARELGVPLADWKRLQRGERVGSVEPEDVLGPPRRGLSIGLVTDTRPTASIADLITGVDLLVCEATFGRDEDQERAIQRKHMTFREAATLARDAGAGQLLLTHFSPSLVEPEAYADNALQVFPNTIVGKDHFSLSLRFPED
jgi:ribonuclease Z